MNELSLVRRGMTASAIGVLSIVVGGLGVATAANGGSLTLGHSNIATKTTTLKDPKGTPLSLIGKKSKPPLKVNSSKQVAHLNASLLAGVTASGLATSGSGASLSPFAAPAGTALSTSIHIATLVARTARLHPGTYFVSATAQGRGGGTPGVTCFVGPTSDSDDSIGSSQNNSGDWEPLATTVVDTFRRPQRIGEFCYSTDASAQVYSAGIFAIKIAHATAGNAPKPLFSR